VPLSWIAPERIAPAMTRNAAAARALAYFDEGGFVADLRRRVAVASESQRPEGRPFLFSYLTDEIGPALAALGFSWRIADDSPAGAPPFLIGARIEDPALPTVLVYGHGDVVNGQAELWREGLSPWALTAEGDRLYGRGTADNKGQHTVNLGALAAVLAARNGRLGFNLKAVFESGEECGSPGLREFCAAHAAELAADVLIASDGPRMSAERPTVFLGSRGSFTFDLSLDLRKGSHHSGNWGGALCNPASVLAHAVAGMIGADGRILVAGLRPPAIPEAVRKALGDITLGGGPGDPAIERTWGEPGLSPEERVFAWNTLEVLSFHAGGDPPANAIPGTARARLQLRYVKGCDPATFLPAIRAHLDAGGFSRVALAPARAAGSFAATRLDPENPWVGWTLASIARTTGKRPALLPNLGGSIPNDAFALVLGLPTIWIPHSYPSCAQHAPDEHLLVSVAREALAIMAGLFWDLGEGGTPTRKDAQS